MTETEFINSIVGTPWVERGDGVNGLDCWGLVVRYYRDVLGIELENDYPFNLASGYIDQILTGKWVPCAKRSGVAFMGFDRNNEPLHVGVVVNGGSHILHASKPTTRCDSVGKMSAHYRMKFYEYRAD